MQSFLWVALAIAMVAVVAILFTGIGGFAAGGEFNRRYGNKLMRARVATQALVLFILLLIALTR